MMDEEFVEKKFENLKENVGIVLAIVLMWDEISKKTKDLFSLDTLHRAYNKALQKDLKKSIYLEMSQRVGTYAEWYRIHLNCPGDERLKKLSHDKMLLTASIFDEYLDLYRKGCKFFSELMSSCSDFDDLINLYRFAKDEHKLIVRQRMLLCIYGVESYLRYIDATGDMSLLRKLKDAELSCSDWISHYLRFRNSDNKKLIDFLLWKIYRSARTFEDFEYVFSLADLRSSSLREQSKTAFYIYCHTESALIRKARSLVQITKLFKMKWGERQGKVVKILCKNDPGFSFIEWLGLYKIIRENDEIKEFVYEKLLKLAVTLDDLLLIWNAAGRKNRTPLLLQMMREEASTLKELATLYNLPGLYDLEGETIEQFKEEIFSQMQKILASQ